MATDRLWRPEPIDLAPEVVLLPGFDGDGADPFLVPVNALLLGAGPRLLVVPGARRAPWTPALATLADQVGWVLSARPAPSADVGLALARCRHAVPLGAVPEQALAAGRFALVDPPTAPVRSRAVLDVGRHVLYGADAFGAPVVLPATDADDLDDAYWREASRTHAWWAGADAGRAAAVAGLGIELIVPAFGPVLRGRRLADALPLSVPIGASVREASESDVFRTEGGIRTQRERAALPMAPPTAVAAAYSARMEELIAGGC